MQQTSDVVLEYHPANSQRGAFWQGVILKREMKFIRVFCALATPQLQGQPAALVIVGELDRSSAPPEFYGLGAAIGSLPEIQNALTQFCVDLRPADIVAEDKESCRFAWQVTDRLVGKLKPLSV